MDEDLGREQDSWVFWDELPPEEEGNVNEWQQTICAIALFLNGHDNVQVGEALGVNKNRAQELIQLGADAMREKRIGYMKSGEATQ